MRTATIGVASVLVSVLLAACGSSARLLTAQDAERAFGEQGLGLHVVVDSRRLSQARILRLTRIAPGDVDVVRAAKLSARTSLEHILARADAHPVQWLSTSPVNLGADAVNVLVWGQQTDAKSNASAARGGGGIVRGSFKLVRVRNVVIIYPTLHASTVDRVNAAVQRLQRQS